MATGTCESREARALALLLLLLLLLTKPFFAAAAAFWVTGDAFVADSAARSLEPEPEPGRSRNEGSLSLRLTLVPPNASPRLVTCLKKMSAECMSVLRAVWKRAK